MFDNLAYIYFESRVCICVVDACVHSEFVFVYGEIPYTHILINHLPFVI